MTIDLTAEEVRSKQARTEAENTGTKPGAREGGGQATAAGGQPKGAQGTAKSAAQSDDDDHASGPGYAGMAIAAGVGAVIALGVAWGAGQAGLLGSGSSQELADMQAALDSTDARFAALDERMREISKTEATPTVAPAVVNDLAARLQDLEQQASTTEGVSSQVQTLSNGLDELRSFVSSGGAGSSAALASLDDSLKKLQSRVGEIGDRVATLEEGASPAMQKTLGELNARLDALDGRTKAASEAASAAAKAASEGDAVAGNTMQTFSSRLDSLGSTLEETKKSVEAIAARASTLEGAGEATRDDIAAIREQLAGIDKRLAAVEEIMGGPGARETASRAIAVSLLKNSVDAGRPYGSELAAVRSALPPDTDLQALEVNADSGIATINELTTAFPDVAARMAATLERVDTGNSVADKFLNNMRSLVSVRATSDGAGSGPMGALGLMQEQVRTGNLDGALETYETLPDGTQNAGKEWAASARARLAADRLVDQVTSEVIKALAKDS